jgi:DNA-binding IclR family transcriptional regulator
MQDKKQTLDKALDLINTMATNNVSMSLSDICLSLEVSRPTAVSITNSLLAQNFIEKNPQSNTYSLGYKLYVLGSIYSKQYTFCYAAEPHLTSLRNRFNLRINLSVIKPPATAIIILAIGVTPIARMPFGCVIPLHASASGKLLLAYSDETEIDIFFKRAKLMKYTTNTITNERILREELSRIKSEGYGLDYGELISNRVCVAVPIFDSTQNVIAAVSLAGIDIDFFDENKTRLVNALQHTGQDISSDLGYCQFPQLPIFEPSE